MTVRGLPFSLLCAEQLTIVSTVIVTVAQFQFSQPTYSVGESDGPGMPTIVLVFGELTFPIDVDVATVAGGSATGNHKTVTVTDNWNTDVYYIFSAGLDYTPVLTQRLTFPSGSAPNAQMPFNVPIIPDNLVEGDETVNLMANTPSNFANVNPDSATLVIRDDDRK